MIKTSTIILVVFLIGQNTLLAQTFDWVKTFGSAENEGISSSRTDAFGNVYITGSFNGTVDFNPGVGINNLTSQGLNDIFVQKLDSVGNYVWSVSIGGSNQDHGRFIELDPSGNIYVLGIFSSSTVDFNPGAGTNIINCSGSNDVFILKLDNNGNFSWVKKTGGSYDDYGNSINLDSNGNIYTIGVFRGTVDFDPGTGVYDLTSAGVSNYGDGFVQKLDPNGNFLWAKQIGGAMNDEAYSSTIDNLGNVYTTGYFQSTADFDPSANNYILTSFGITDVFVQKLNSAGDFVWAKQIGGASFDYSFSMGIDQDNNVYTSGYFLNTADFNPGTATFNLTASGGADIYIQKMNSSGDFVWAKSIGGIGYDNVNGIFVDQYNNVHMIGTFEGTIDLNPNAGVNSFSSIGTSDMFILKLNSAGQFLRAKTMGGTGTDYPNGIYVDNSSNIYFCGSYQSTVDLDPTSTVNSNTSIGGSDAFIVKLNQCYGSTINNTEIACDSFTWIDGITYFSNNSSANLTVYASNECDVIMSLDLIVNFSENTTQTLTSCDTYTWIDGNTYTTSNNTATFALTNVNGCDSIITLNLTILNPSSSTDIQTACDSFTWSINNQTYTTSGQYIDTIPNAAGCDSIITLDLTIIPSLPLTVSNTFTLPSDANACVGELAMNVSGNADFELNLDNGSQIVNTSGYSLINNLCPGVHDLLVTDNCGDTLSTQFVISIDSNYVFNNPFIDSIAVDSLGTTISNCDIYYNSFDTAYIDSIWATGNTVNVIWNIVDANGSNFDTTSYVLNNGNGIYWLQLSVFCPTKALGDFFTVTEAIYFNNGTISTADLTENAFQFALYPNPTNSEVTLTFDSNEAQVIVYDTKGKLIQTKSIHSGEQVSLKEVETGVYFFEVMTEKGSAVKRVVKN